MKKEILLIIFIFSMNSLVAQFELLNTFSKKKHLIIDVAYNKDNKSIATCGTDQSILIWDIKGQVIKNIGNLPFLCTDIQFSADGKYLVSIGESKKVLIWDLEKGNLRFSFEGHKKRVTCFSVSKNGLLATGAEDNTLIIWDLNTGKQLNTIQAHNGAIKSISFNTDGTMLATSGEDKKIKIWETTTGALEKEIKEISEPVKGLKYSPNNNSIVAITGKNVLIFNTINGLLDKDIKKAHGIGTLTSLDLSNDGNYVLIGSDDKKFSIWNINGTNIFMSERQLQPVLRAIFSPDGKQILSADFTTELKIWNSSSLKIKVPEILADRSEKKDFNAPTITITTPGLKRGFKPSVKKETYSVTGKITDESAIMLVFINGIEVKLTSDGEFTSALMLKDGENAISIKAIDVYGNKSEENLFVNLDRGVTPLTEEKDSVKTVAIGKFYALIIGIANYQDPAIPDLNNMPIEDSKTLAEILISNYTFNQENVQILKDATRRDILVAFDNLAKTMTDEDNLLIFYAGHGYYEKDNDIGYWLPQDAEKDFTANWIYNNNLVDLIKKIKTKHTLLLSDACFSGSIFRKRDATFMKDASKAYVNLYSLKSRKAMTSGTLETVPNRSMFFEYLTKNLMNNPQKYMSSRELFGKLANDVGNTTDNVPQWGDIPGIGDEGGDFIFIRK